MKFIIRGNKKCEGSVKNSGSKNSAVAIIPASILAEGDVVLRNIPDIDDVRTLITLLKTIGYQVFFQNNILTIKENKTLNHKIKSSLVNRMRGSYYFMGSFLGRLGKVNIQTCGGCNLGQRPINFHLQAFRKLGAIVREYPGSIKITSKKLTGNNINLDFPSVGATINTMLAAVKADGRTVITNCAREPEVADVGNFLLALGADICGLGTDVITIIGVRRLSGCDYTIISDRIEAGTYLILGALCAGSGITVSHCDPSHHKALIKVLSEVGCALIIGENEITIKKERPLAPFSITTSPYPGFPTDLGQIMSVLATQITGLSKITETIFSNRLSHIEELKKMGSDITITDNTILIKGGTNLMPADVYAYDLRGAAALVLAAAMTIGSSCIQNIEVLLRGYENPIKKLRLLGLDIELKG